MYKLIQYLKFLFTATNQHGVHSPFIYNYVTKCLYTRPNFQYSKAVNVLLKSIDYFQVSQLTLSEDNKIHKLVRQHFPHVRFVKKNGDILWLSANEPKKLNMLLSEENSFQNDSILFIDAIHTSVENHKAWKKVKMQKKVTVTIDMFFCGAVFFRKEQVEEHFKIRI